MRALPQQSDQCPHPSPGSETALGRVGADTGSERVLHLFPKEGTSGAKCHPEGALGSSVGHGEGHGGGGSGTGRRGALTAGVQAAPRSRWLGDLPGPERMSNADPKPKS